MQVTVTGARGGVGATALAVGLAVELDAVLVDVDGLAGGVDIWLEGESVPGVRWSGLGLAGGALGAGELRAALPRIGGTAVLAADRPAVPQAAGLSQVLEVLAGGPVVVDLPRVGGELAAAAVTSADLVVLVLPPTPAGVVAAHVRLEVLRPCPAAVGLVTVGEGLAAATVGDGVGAPVLAAVAAVADLDAVAAGLADGLRVPS